MKILKKKNFISSKGADEFLRNDQFESGQIDLQAVLR